MASLLKALIGFLLCSGCLGTTMDDSPSSIMQPESIAKRSHTIAAAFGAQAFTIEGPRDAIVWLNASAIYAVAPTSGACFATYLDGDRWISAEDGEGLGEDERIQAVEPGSKKVVLDHLKLTSTLTGGSTNAMVILEAVGPNKPAVESWNVTIESDQPIQLRAEESPGVKCATRLSHFEETTGARVGSYVADAEATITATSTGCSHVHVFVDSAGDVILTGPEGIEEWRNRNLSAEALSVLRVSLLPGSWNLHLEELTVRTRVTFFEFDIPCEGAQHLAGLDPAMRQPMQESVSRPRIGW